MKQNNTASRRFLLVAPRGIEPLSKLLFYPLNYKAAFILVAKITVSVDLTRIKMQVPFSKSNYLASIGQ